MIGTKLAAAIRASRGKIQAGMITPGDVAYVYVEKSDLIRWAQKYGERETGMYIEEHEGSLYFENDPNAERE